MQKRLGDIAPYTLTLCAAIGLYFVADSIAYTAIPGQIGPDQWPKIILTLLISVCIFEIGRKTLIGDVARTDSDPALGFETDLMASHATNARPVFGTVAATVGYLLLLETCGFFLCTLAYTACLMWLGGLRRLTIIAVMAGALSLFFTFIFMKVIFVALPIGHGGFAKISLAIMNLAGVH